VAQVVFLICLDLLSRQSATLQQCNLIFMHGEVLCKSGIKTDPKPCLCVCIAQDGRKRLHMGYKTDQQEATAMRMPHSHIETCSCELICYQATLLTKSLLSQQ
jgi:hypothetical protein